jgi:phosphomethylpyrimidine synthase
VRISKEIVQFVSGKDARYARGAARVSAALTAEQRAILERRGVLSPEELHRLAGKTRRRVGAEPGHKAACHSDVADAEEAHRIQGD